MIDDFEGDPTSEIFARLRALLAACGSNKNHAMIVLTDACISEGWTTRRQIVGALRVLGFKNGHVNRILNTSTGASPERYRWNVDEEGHYSIH